MYNKYLNWFFFIFFFSLIFFYYGVVFSFMDYMIFFEYEFFFLNSFSMFYVIILDWKCLFFISIVMFISSLVILYSMQYMGCYSFSSLRFLYIVLLFILSMFLMIISPNLLSILLGWDGLGLVSYCLVIYYSSMKSYLSGMITCLINRLGDCGMIICLGWMFSLGSWHFIFFNNFYFNFLVYMIIFCSFTKSAQVPFSCWLPEAMSAPTPVSALVHSSTLVTAGVYMMIRFFSFLNINSNFFVIIGLFTMLFSSFCANYEFDLKKIIALSTLSQLGLMMSSLFMNLIDFSYFHMLTHAMFKSLLFLCSGIYIYNLSDSQDIRYMGSFCSFMPLTTSCFNISNLSLCGLPFLSGFYSKDLIIESSFFFSLNFYIFFLFYLSLGLTCCYSSRLLYYSVFKSYFLMSLLKSLDYLDFMKISILVLTFFSVVFGCFFIWLMNLDLNFLFFPFYLKLICLIMVFLGFMLGFELSNFFYFFNLNFYIFNSYMWFMYGYSYFLYNFFYNYSFYTYNFVYWGEFFTAYSSYYFMMFSDFFQFYVFNNMKIYMISFFISFIFILI